MNKFYLIICFCLPFLLSLSCERPDLTDKLNANWSSVNSGSGADDSSDSDTGAYNNPDSDTDTSDPTDDSDNSEPDSGDSEEEKCKNSGETWNGTECERHLTLGNVCTGQNKCYNNEEEITCSSSSSADFYGQDAQYAAQGKCTPQSFTVQTISSQKVVLDNNNGLMWQQTIQTSTYAWSGAFSYCDGSTYAGYRDWRLPTPQELLTIVDNSRYNPAIDTTYFPNTPSGGFWSSISYQ